MNFLKVLGTSDKLLIRQNSHLCAPGSRISDAEAYRAAEYRTSIPTRAA